MAYRSGWATKPGQTRVLRIHLKRAGFEWALAHSTLSHYDPAHHESEQAGAPPSTWPPTSAPPRPGKHRLT
jgi:hypothetical protein